MARLLTHGTEEASHGSLLSMKFHVSAEIRGPTSGPRPQLPPIGYAPAGDQDPAQYTASVDQMYQAQGNGFSVLRIRWR